MAGILDKDIKAEVIKMFKELMKDVEKVKKMFYEQNGNQNLKGNKKKKFWT